MIVRHRFSLIPVLLLSTACSAVLHAGEEAEGLEISSRPQEFSCLYYGVKEENGETVVPLRFRNATDREIVNILAGFRVRRADDGKLVYSTGVTYGFPIPPGETRDFTLFRWLPMKPDVRKALVEEKDRHSVALVVDEITFAE
ncbi:MAG TPA: hypothetical protein PK636_01685 [bacterium]|nr:hypothetical protein [bacterium]HPJ71376.1 hypothetical protein [bacterium]HPQ66434.1 hypothetical protein [bacterium]